MTGEAQFKTQSCSATGESCAKDSGKLLPYQGMLALLLPERQMGMLGCSCTNWKAAVKPQVLTWNAKFVSVAQGTGFKVFAALPPESPGDAQSEGDGRNVGMFAFWV